MARWLLVLALAGACAGERTAPPSQPPGATSAVSATAAVSDAGAAAAPDASAPPAADARTGAPDDLVELVSLAPTIVVELRYASADNFTGQVIYPAARCLLRREVAERLARVQATLAGAGRGLKVWDCYRPFSVQEAFWRRVPDPRYVARPVRRRGVPASGSKHNRGAAVDLTLVDAAGAELEMPTGFDDFTARAHRGHTGASAAARAHAAELEAAMVAEGFAPLPTEWWHFDAPGWRRFPLADLPL